MIPPGIRIGTLVPGSATSDDYIRQILPHGFESFELTFGWKLDGLDLADLARRVKDALGDTGAVVAALGCYGNVLKDDEQGVSTRGVWETLIDNIHHFGTDLVCGFAGRVPGKSIPDCMPRYKEVFGALSKRAADQGVRIAFENCDMGGTWQSGDHNIAHYPKAWEMMFDTLPADNIGLEWEPCHQMVKLIDPMPQLRKWVSKVFHIHGKDATIKWDVIRERGITAGETFAFHRTPGFGDSNWTDIISELRQGGFTGSIDIEGWHDPVYRGDLEMTGQVHALHYLKQCRGGDFVPNPS